MPIPTSFFQLAEVQLYLLVLEMQEKYQEALDVLHGPLGGTTALYIFWLAQSLTSYLEFVPQHEVELLTKLGRWDRVNSVCKSLLLSKMGYGAKTDIFLHLLFLFWMPSPDNWQYFEKYLDSVEKLQSSGWTPPADGSGEEEALNPAVDYSYSMALAFINSLKELRKGGLLRGPSMAQVVVLARDKASPDVLGEQPLGGIGIVLVDKMEASLQASLPDSWQKPPTLGAMQQHLTVCQLRHYVTDCSALKPEERLRVAEGLFASYLNGLQFGACADCCFCTRGGFTGAHKGEDRIGKGGNRADLLPTDFQPSDNYAVLAACVLLEHWQESGTCGSRHPRWLLAFSVHLGWSAAMYAKHRNSFRKQDNYLTGTAGLLLRLLVALEQALIVSPSCFQIKLLLLKVYARIGGAGPCQHFAEQLDIKHIQHDTLGYLMTPVYLKAGHYQAASANMNLALKLYTGNYKDVQEMMEFRERLNNSLHFATLTVEKMILELLLEVKRQGGLESPEGQQGRADLPRVGGNPEVSFLFLASVQLRLLSCYCFPRWCAGPAFFAAIIIPVCVTVNDLVAYRVTTCGGFVYKFLVQ
ncbi:hypothetical protein HPB48_006298 [Haemaphysalis longicornis]|uniref:Uncharacterized protein n=1 Tax=Haemaphysalis longicornis TaxID=44386 RepID=A0A9J6GQB2_HAELO|nr:hypothetical protein HPB48_006298 [Haemaphysalis longicornis]